MLTRPWKTFATPRGQHDSERAKRLAGFVHEHVPGHSRHSAHGPATAAWRALRSAGSELWLDAADLGESLEVWTEDFSGVTTNNSLLNAEVGKGVYDELAVLAAAELRREDEAMESPELLGEIAFVLNALHGLTIARALDAASVSVELHTALADDAEGSYQYGRRLAAIAPLSFVVKVPLTPAGLLAARRLAADGVRVNCTLAFSPRQNQLIAAYARPHFTNVFVGRVDQLVDAAQAPFDVGVAATQVSQRAVHAIDALHTNDHRVRQIGASLRNAEQVAHLAGVDVLTMPLRVAREVAERRAAPITHDEQSDAIPDEERVAPLRADGAAVFVEGSDAVQAVARQLVLREDDTMDAARLTAVLADHGLADLFPPLRPEEQMRLDADGKIPDWGHWRESVVEGRCSWDGLLNAAGLLHFAADQAELDAHVAELL